MQTILKENVVEEAKKPQGEGSDMLTPLLGKILQVPGVRINRETFLREQFKMLHRRTWN